MTESTEDTGAFEAYLEKLPKEQREALQRLREAIRKAAPTATECISYQLPAFRHEGKMLVGLGATSKHCALYLMSSTIVESFAEELSRFSTSKGTVRFQPDQPLSATLVKQLVKARMAENKK